MNGFFGKVTTVGESRSSDFVRVECIRQQTFISNKLERRRLEPQNDAHD